MPTIRVLNCGRARTGVREVKLATAGRQTLLTGPQLNNMADTISLCVAAMWNGDKLSNLCMYGQFRLQLRDLVC